MKRPPVENSGRFRSGERTSPSTEIKPRQHFSPATEIKRGQRLSAKTEFKKGQPAHNWLPLGSETVRVDPQGNLRGFVKIAEPNKWRQRAVVNWERANGCALPRGMVVHHKDRNALNDSIDNLVALTRAEHAREHVGELHDAQRSK